jgi:hypothetical protein
MDLTLLPCSRLLPAIIDLAYVLPSLMRCWHRLCNHRHTSSIRYRIVWTIRA